jgi:prophage regulatory protein
VRTHTMSSGRAARLLVHTTSSRTPIVMGMAREKIRLMGAHEIRMRLGGISRQRVYQITNRSDFPKPTADLAQGKIWLTGAVETWIEQHRHT